MPPQSIQVSAAEMIDMPPKSDAHAEQRHRLLDPVAEICRLACVPVARGWFSPHGYSAPIAALLCPPDDGSWDATLTVVRAHRVAVEHQAYNKPWSRDPRNGYDLTSAGKVLYELQIHEDDDGAGGHGPRPLVVFELLEQARAVADALIEWWQRPARFRARPALQTGGPANGALHGSRSTGALRQLLRAYASTMQPQERPPSWPRSTRWRWPCTFPATAAAVFCAPRWSHSLRSIVGHRACAAAGWPFALRGTNSMSASRI